MNWGWFEDEGVYICASSVPTPYNSSGTVQIILVRFQLLFLDFFEADLKFLTTLPVHQLTAAYH